MRHSVARTLKMVLFLFTFLLPVSFFGQSQNPQPNDSTANAPQREASPAANAGKQEKNAEGAASAKTGLQCQMERCELKSREETGTK